MNTATEREHRQKQLKAWVNLIRRMVRMSMPISNYLLKETMIESRDYILSIKGK